jgi:hypothetical protein
VSRVVFRPLWTALTVIGLTVSGLTVIGLTAGDSATPVRPARAEVVVASSPGTGSGTGASDPPFRSVRSYPEVAAPVRLRIPAQRISTSLQRLGLAADGTIAAPTQWQVAGWYARGPRPGQQGPAVIVGHIDSKTGPAVFYRLPALKPGDVVYVDREDGSTARFRVTGHRQVAKARFPAKTVYSPTLQSSLLLITCGGTFDRSTGHYRDNLIVTAVPG